MTSERQEAFELLKAALLDPTDKKKKDDARKHPLLKNVLRGTSPADLDNLREILVTNVDYQGCSDSGTGR
jgi:hypothetical protein